MIRFTIEFEEPTREQELAVACPFCKADPGERCRTERYSWSTRSRASKHTSVIHHDRTAAALGLTIIRSSSIYRLP